jgi:hypothetical protein
MVMKEFFVQKIKVSHALLWLLNCLINNFLPFRIAVDMFPGVADRRTHSRSCFCDIGFTMASNDPKASTT